MLQTAIANTPQVRPYIDSLFLTMAPDMSRVISLTENDREEALAFLAVRPVQTVVMSSFITDNGIESELNRGKFFAYRGRGGDIEGIALIGHTTLVEARSEAALKTLGHQARNSETPLHLIMSSGNDAERFWLHYTGGLKEPRLRCAEALFEVAFPYAVQKCEWNIGNADMSQLELVAEAQAEIAFVECGVDPMLADRVGFLKRVARRIEQDRVFTVFEDGELIFKADIIAETPETIYLEGIYVHPDYRGKSVGSSCLAALTLRLLNRVENICMLSNVDFAGAHKSYHKAGYKQTDQSVTLFV